MWRDLRTLFSYRRLIFSTAFNEVRQRFAGSIFGIGWAVLFPLMQLSIYATLYAVIFKIRPSGLTEYQYVLMVFSGLVPLFIFNEAIQAATNSLYANKSILMNASIPAEVIPLRSALAAQLPPLIGLLVTLAVGVYLEMTTWFAFALLPVYWLFLFMFALGLGWILSLVSLVVKDIGHAIGLVLMMAMFLSPFAYTQEMVPVGLRAILYLNPLTYFVLPFQQAITFNQFAEPHVLGGMAALGVVFFFLGFYIFMRRKFDLIDYA